MIFLVLNNIYIIELWKLIMRKSFFWLDLKKTMVVVSLLLCARSMTQMGIHVRDRLH